MTADELRAMTAQGPAVVMVAKADMLALLDERDALRDALKGMVVAADRGRVPRLSARGASSDALALGNNRATLSPPLAERDAARVARTAQPPAKLAPRDFLAGFAAGAAKEWQITATCVQDRLAEMPDSVRDVMVFALVALGIDDLAETDGGCLADEDDARQAWMAR